MYPKKTTLDFSTTDISKNSLLSNNTVKILNIGTYMSEQNSVDPDQTALKEQSDQDLHCLPFCLHLLEALLHCKIILFYIKDDYVS